MILTGLYVPLQSFPSLSLHELYPFWKSRFLKRSCESVITLSHLASHQNLKLDIQVRKTKGRKAKLSLLLHATAGAALSVWQV